MKTEATSVWSELPATRTIEPISPSARANARTEPERIPGRMFGRTIRRKTGELSAPRSEQLPPSRRRARQHWLHGPDDERERDEAEGEHDRRPREGEFDPDRRIGP
jgi:hypothetical protein